MDHDDGSLPYASSLPADRDMDCSTKLNLSEDHAIDCSSESKTQSSSALLRDFCFPAFNDDEKTNILDISPCKTGVSALHNNVLQQISVQQRLDQNEELSRKPEPLHQITYNKKPGTANVRGQLYKIQLSTLFLFEGLKGKANEKIDAFHLAANMQEAGDFKDVVFKYKYKNRDLFQRNQSNTEKTKIIFLHSRHVDKTENKKFTLDFRATDPKVKDPKVKDLKVKDPKVSGNLDFNLQKHFISYRRIKKLFSERKHEHPIFGNCIDNINCDFIFYTNALFDFTESAKIARRIDVDEKDILYLDGKPDTHHYYQIVYDDDEKTEEATKSLTKRTEEITDILQNSSNCRKLAKDLAKSVFPKDDGKKPELINQGILKEYHLPLSKTVIEKKITKETIGKFKTSFLNCDECLSQRDKNFRNVFFEEAKRITGKSQDELEKELRSKSIKLSDKFGEHASVSHDSETLSLPNDHVTADEIKEFLRELKIFVGQPGEDQLAKIIKKKTETTFKIEHGDVGSIYSDVKTKVERWWKEENYYLTERNRFFKDSLRISIFFEVKRPIELFTGRKTQIDDLHRLMQHSPRETEMISQIVAVTGLGGIGKTELARQYIYKHSQDYNNIIWIKAESYEDLVASFHRLAQDKLKISTKTVDGNKKDIKSVVDEIYKYFSKRKSLFIFDNAEKYRTQEVQDSGIDKFLPTFSQNIKTYILITSRSREWQDAKILSLGVFTKEEATEYIKSALNIVTESQEQEAEQLSEMLQYFPLALRQAVAYIREENRKLVVNEGLFSISCYLEEYKREGTEEKLLSFESHSNDYDGTTYVTCKITLQKIAKMNYGEQALGILNVMAYFVPDSISTKIFLALVPGKRELGGALQLLKQYSIIELEQEEANIHRLVQQVTRTELKRHKKEKDVLRDALQLVEGAMKEESKADSRCVSHAISAWTHASKYEELVKSFHSLPCEIMSVLDNSVRYEEAYLFGNRAYVLLENLLGANHFDTLLVENAVAVTLDRSGKYDEALKAYEGVVSKFTQTLGSDHYCTVSVKHNMAGSLKNHGKYEEALKICEEVLNQRKKILGESHRDTLTTMNDIAIVLKHQGKYGEALKVYQVVVDKRKEVLGCDHRDTLMTKHGMALVFFLDKKYDEAYDILREVLDKRNEILGFDHPDTLMTKNNMASVLCHKRKYEDALVAFQELVKKTEKVLGANHPHTLLAKVGIGHTFYDMGSYEEALVIFQEVLDDKQMVLGLNHPETLQTQHNKATVLIKQGKYDEALLTYSELLDKEKSAFGPEHPVTLATESNKALVISEKGRYDESLSILEEVVEKEVRVRGPKHPNTLATQHNIACVLHSKGNYSEALRMYEMVLEMRNEILEADHPDVLMTRKNIAALLSDMGKYNEALEFYRDVFDKCQQVLSRDHPDTLTVERNIAGVIHRLGRFDEALTAYQAVLDKGEQILSRSHPENLVTLTNMANVLDDKGYYHLALKIYEKVLNKREKTLGFNHPDTLVTKHCIASTYYNQGNHNEALKIYRDVLHRRNEVLGSDHPATLHTQNSVAEVVDSRQNYQESSKVYQDVLNKRKGILGSDHPDTLKTMDDMARSLCNQGKHDEALNAYHIVLDKRKHTLGSLHPSTLSTQNSIAVVLHNQGNYSEAMKTYEEVFNTRKKALGPDHPQTMTTLDEIAALLDDQGYSDKSLEAHREVLNKRKRHLGPNHPDTLTTENNMAAVFFKQKLYKEALKMYRDVLDKRKQILGRDNPCTLLTQNNIATILHAQGNYDCALKMYEEVLEKRKLVLPFDSPDILVSLSSIAEVLEDKECFDTSLKIHQDVLVKREKVLGPCHPDTLRSKNFVAAGLLRQGDYEEALKLYSEVLRTREKMLGPDNVSVLATQNNIAVVLHHLEKYEEAIQIYLKVLDKRKKVLGIDHPDTLCTMHNIATALYNCGKYEEALEIDQKVLDKRKRILGPDHPSTLFTVNRLVSVLCDQGKYYDVLKSCVEMLDKEKVLELYNNSSLCTGNTVLHVITSYGKLDIIQHLIENGADILSRNVHDTLLHQAVNNSNREVIKLILTKMKEKYENIALYIDAPDEDGDTPLMWAAETGNISSFQVLLEYGADVNARNKNGWTALHWAAKGGHAEIIELLVGNRADPNTEDKTGRTALRVACENLDRDAGDQENLKTVTALLMSVTG